jgi:hypothetical protein
MAAHNIDMRVLLRKAVPPLLPLPQPNYRARAWESFGPALDRHLALKRRARPPR